MKLDLTGLTKWRIAHLEAAGGFVAAGIAPIGMRRGERWVRFSVLRSGGTEDFAVALCLDHGRGRRLSNVEVKRFMRLAGFKVEREIADNPPVRAFVLRERRSAAHRETERSIVNRDAETARAFVNQVAR